tara:strand:- start:4257 stop:5429 length:1173 start_codon:yes stop_codon:yes gene_type:complete
MISDIIILGSTGSIGKTTLSIVKKNRKFKVKLLTSKQNINELYKQAVLHKVKNVIIDDEKKYNLYENKFKKKKIKLHLGIKNINKILKNKVTYCINSISGIEGLEPTLKVIPKTKNILVANKESIICGWNFIVKKLKKNNTNFIPIDSEHFSIWQLIKNHKINDVEKIVLTASGGPFFNIPRKKFANISPKFALNHPNWKMGRKISIDSSTMMNKVFEFIEAKNIFNLKKNKLSILIHPSSFVHAIIYLKGQLIKFLAHDTNMSIPISYALGIKKKSKKPNLNLKIKKLNSINFSLPKKSNYPLISILKFIPDKTSYFETILITLNDSLVDKYLKGKINYISIHNNLLYFINCSYFKKYYKLKPKNIYDINKMIKITKKYLDFKLKHYVK